MSAVLLDAGANPNAPAFGGFTPLHSAASINRNPTVLKVLLDGGANPAMRTADGDTACDFAQERDRLWDELGIETGSFAIHVCVPVSGDGG